jgi:hypothetical protein
MKKQHQYDENDHLVVDNTDPIPDEFSPRISWNQAAIIIILLSMFYFAMKHYFPAMIA